MNSNPHPYKTIILVALGLLVAGIGNKGLIAGPTEDLMVLSETMEASDKTKIIHLIASGADINAKNSNGNTPLYEASKHGHIGIVIFLLKNNTDVNATSAKNAVPLHVAVLNGHIKTVKLLLNHKADVNAALSNGSTALMLAIYHEQLEVANLLLQYNPNIHAASKDGYTALCSAVQRGYTALTKVLLDAGAKADPVENNIDSSKTIWAPLVLAANQGHTEIVKTLIQAKANVNAVNGRGWTPLIAAARSGRMDIVKLLLQTKADVNLVDNVGREPLVYTILLKKDSKENVTALLKAGADIHFRGFYGGLNDLTLLHHAAFSGSFENIPVLIEAGINVNVTVPGDLTPLHVAAMKGNLEFVSMLLQAKANVNLRDSNGATPLWLAVLNGHTEVVARLLQANADVNAHSDLISSSGHWKDNKTMYFGLDTIFYGLEPLHVAAMSGHADIVDALIKAKANVNATTSDGLTPLHLTSLKDDFEIVTDILRDKGKVKALTQFGKVPLYIYDNGEFSVSKTDAAVTAFNLEHSHAGHHKDTFFEAGSMKVLKALLKAKADVNAIGPDGLTPMAMAKQNGNDWIVEMLKEHGAK